MSMSLTQSRYLDRHADLLKSAVPVLNTSNIHLDILRPTLLLSGLEVIQRNQNRQNLDLKFYEFGHNYLREGQNYREEEILAIFLTGMRTPPNWITASEREVDFYTLKGYTEAVLERMNVRDTVEKDITDSGYWHFGREIYSEEILLATYGQVDPDWVTEFDLRHPVFYTEFRWHELLKITRAAGTTVEEIGRFPAVKRDLAVIVDKALTFEQIRDLVGQHGDGLIREIVLFDVYDKAEVLGENKKSYAFRLTFENPDRTLKDKDVDKIMRAIIRDLDKQLGAKLR
jgi:phenylalanyl-tRNA synthetase beta chain